MLNILSCFGKFPGETFNAKLKKIKNKKIGTNTDLANFEKTEQLISCMLLSCHVRFSEQIYTLQFPECQGTSWSKQAQYLKFK